MGFVTPQITARFVAVNPVGLLGRSELRATYGGFFLALGLACIVLDSPELYLAVGIAWLGAAVGRVVSAMVDSSYSLRNIGAIFFEAIIGGTLIA